LTIALLLTEGAEDVYNFNDEKEDEVANTFPILILQNHFPQPDASEQVFWMW